MLKVLLVDDEPFILEGLSVIIDWNKEGFEIIDKVSNAFEALEVLQREDIDLVIADIKMPKMTGLELVEKVYGEKISEAYFVMLSGYNDFRYVRAALQHKCLDYMLKPISQDELLKVLDRVRNFHEINRKERMESSIMEREVFAKNMIPICRGRYRADNVEYVQKYLGESKGFRYISVELDERDDALKRVGGGKKRQLQKELYQKCLLLFPGKEYLCMFDVALREQSYNVGIVYSPDMADAQNELSEAEYLENLRKEIKASVDFPIIIIVGSRVERIEDIADSCKTVLMSYSFRNFDLREDPISHPSDKLVNKQLIDALVHAVKVNDKENIESGCKEILEEMKSGRSDARMIDMGINYLMFELLHLASEQDENINQREVFHFINENALEQINAEGGEENIIGLLLEYGDYLTQLRANQNRGVLSRIEEDLKENFRENLTLKDLSKKYYVNAAYLGQSFKKQYGESFKDYLNRIRIEAAVELLMYSDKKIYEIAEEVGYKDLDYFINKFIALKGCTPAKFRKQMK